IQLSCCKEKQGRSINSEVTCIEIKKHVGTNGIFKIKKVGPKPDLNLCKLKRNYNFSIIPAAPCPVPTHIVTIPYFLLVRFNSLITCTDNLAPVQPSGCPIAIAPPLGFTLA